MAHFMINIYTRTKLVIQEIHADHQYIQGNNQLKQLIKYFVKTNKRVVKRKMTLQYMSKVVLDLP